jgi:non-heme Fe2+,alpha-ketoglutarate-dependent halogenase
MKDDLEDAKQVKSLVDYVADADQLKTLTFAPVDPAAARTLSADDLRRFNRDGFISPLRAFDTAESVSIRNYIDGLVAAVVSAPDRRNSYSINSYHIVCRGLYDLIKSPVLLDYVEDFLGPDFVCWGLHLFSKDPSDPMEVPLHQDAAYWPLTPANSVSVWIAVDDADEANSAMQFVPGSHLFGPLPHETKELDGTRVLKRQVLNADSFGERFTNTLRAGEISIHSDLLLHGSQANRSNRRRAGLTIRYTAASVRAVPGYEHWNSVAVHCRGNVPDHWPNRARPDGEHPELMASIWGDFDGIPLDAS